MHIFQLIRSYRLCSHVEDFNAHNKCLTDKLLKQGCRYHKLRKALVTIIIRTKRIGYDPNVMRHSACLVINPITVDVSVLYK